MRSLPPAQPHTWARATSHVDADWKTHAARRRVACGVLGLLLGLAYGMMSQLANALALLGVPLYQPPFGVAGNILLMAVVGAGLGLTVALPESPSLGIFAGSVAAAAAVFVSALFRLGSLLSFSGAAITGIVLSVPLAWLAVPMVALLRWAGDSQVDEAQRGTPLLARARVPVVMVLVVAVLAAFELLGADARTELRHAQAMLSAGSRAATESSLPAPLQGPLVRDYLAQADHSYTLQWTPYDLDRFIRLRPASSYDQHAAVIARFPGGYTLVCLYPTPRTQPNCGTY